MPNVILKQIEQFIDKADYDSAQELIPVLSKILSGKNEAGFMLDILSKQLKEHDLQCQQSLLDLKNILVG